MKLRDIVTQCSSGTVLFVDNILIFDEFGEQRKINIIVTLTKISVKRLNVSSYNLKFRLKHST